MSEYQDFVRYLKADKAGHHRPTPPATPRTNYPPTPVADLVLKRAIVAIFNGK